MSEALVLAEQQLLAPGGLDHSDLVKVLDHLMGSAVDAGDLYFQHIAREAWSLEDGLVRNATHSVEQGVGIRAISGEKTGFAYADEIVLPSLMQASTAARAIAHHGSSGAVQAWHSQETPALYLPQDPMESMSADKKVDLLRQVDTYARSLDPRVSQVMVNLAASHDTILVAATDGSLAADIRPLVRLSVTVIAEQDGRREQGSDGGGGRFDYSQLTQDNSWQKFADEAVRQALVNLEAENAPAGTMTVVLGPGWPKRIQAVEMIELSPLVQATTGKRVFPYPVRIDEAQPGALTVDWKIVNVSPSKHTGYAVQWFTMAAALFVVYVLHSSSLWQLIARSGRKSD